MVESKSARILNDFNGFSDETALGISVHDHIIVGKNGHASLKGMRLI